MSHERAIAGQYYERYRLWHDSMGIRSEGAFLRLKILGEYVARWLEATPVDLSSEET